MDGFNFRDKYVDLKDDEKTEEDIQDEILKLRLDDDDDDDTPNGGDDNHIRKQKKRPLGIIALIFFFFLFLGGAFCAFIVYQSSGTPVATDVHIESNRFDNSSLAYYGDMITLSFSFDRELSNKPTVVIMNKQVEVYGEGKDYYVKYSVQMQDRTDTLVSFSISDYRDRFQKTGPPITTTTDGSSVTIPAFH